MQRRPQWAISKPFWPELTTVWHWSSTPGGTISLRSVPWIEDLFTFYKIYTSRRGVSGLTTEQRDHVQVPLDGVAADLAAPSLVGVV
jgi:hypothetical protein